MDPPGTSPLRIFYESHLETEEGINVPQNDATQAPQKNGCFFGWETKDIGSKKPDVQWFFWLLVSGRVYSSCCIRSFFSEQLFFLNVP